MRYVRMVLERESLVRALDDLRLRVAPDLQYPVVVDMFLTHR
jgi:hypothetical protein